MYGVPMVFTASISDLRPGASIPSSLTISMLGFDITFYLGTNLSFFQLIKVEVMAELSYIIKYLFKLCISGPVVRLYFCAS